MLKGMTMDIDRKEAIDNLRVAVKASLLVVKTRDYRVWACKYLEQTEPRVEGLEELNERAKERIAVLTDMQPWRSCGRARDCWRIVTNIACAHRWFTEDDWYNSSLVAVEVANKSRAVAERSLDEIRIFQQQLEVSLYGETVS